MINVDSSVQAAMELDNPRFCWLVQLPGPSYWTDHGVPVTWNSVTYENNGYLLNIPPVLRERDIRMQSYAVTVSAVEQDVAQTVYDFFASRNMTGETCRVSLAMLDNNDAVIGDIIGMYEGTFDSWSNQDQGKSEKISIKISNIWSKPHRTAGRITSPDTQEAHYPGDKFFEYAHRERSNLGWGSKE